MSTSDAALIARVVATDDRHAFRTLVRRHQGTVRALLRRLTAGDDALADDLAQDTFLKAYRSLRGYRAQAKFSSWLYRIAYTTFISHRRTAKKAPLSLEDHVPSNPPQQDDTGAQLDLHRAMGSLRPEERAALALTYAQELTQTEAAEILGWPVGTLKTHVLRGKDKLRHRLKAYAVR
ncbi:MAG: RNA polymerase sigma factor [Myxococcota bacterium]